jgi:hypothetical protein
MSTNCSICDLVIEGDDIHVCEVCGEPFCYQCAGDERNYCGFCTREKEVDDNYSIDEDSEF